MLSQRRAMTAILAAAALTILPAWPSLAAGIPEAPGGDCK